MRFSAFVSWTIQQLDAFGAFCAIYVLISISLFDPVLVVTNSYLLPLFRNCVSFMSLERLWEEEIKALLENLKTKYSRSSRRYFKAHPIFSGPHYCLQFLFALAFSTRGFSFGSGTINAHDRITVKRSVNGAARYITKALRAQHDVACLRYVVNTYGMFCKRGIRLQAILVQRRIV